MGRPRRLFPRDHIFHVSNGAAGGRLLFPSDDDYARFLDLLDRREWYGSTKLLGYCLMPTHWHLVLSPWSGWDLSAFVRGVTLMHTRWWHERRGTRGAGPIYRGRFRAFAVEPGAALVAVLRHVERNPVRAGLVGRAEDWRWSSRADRLNPEPGRDRPRIAPVLLPPDWVGYVNQLPPAVEWAAVRQSIRRGCPLGSADWRREVASRLGLELTLRRRGRPRKAAD